MVTIIWDRDDVLNDLMRCWLEQWWKPAHPECTITYEDLKENPPHRLLRISKHTYVQSLDEFRLSPLADSMQPVPEILDWFRQCGHRYHHMVLTATSLVTVPAAAAWTFRHFGAWIQSFHIVPSPREGQQGAQGPHFTDKGTYLTWLGKGDILVDDSPINCAEAERCGLTALLIPRPWNGATGGIADALRRVVA